MTACLLDTSTHTIHALVEPPRDFTQMEQTLRCTIADYDRNVLESVGVVFISSKRSRSFDAVLLPPGWTLIPYPSLQTLYLFDDDGLPRAIMSLNYDDSHRIIRMQLPWRTTARTFVTTSRTDARTGRSVIWTALYRYGRLILDTPLLSPTGSMRRRRHGLDAVGLWLQRHCPTWWDDPLAALMPA